MPSETPCNICGLDLEHHEEECKSGKISNNRHSFITKLIILNKNKHDVITLVDLDGEKVEYENEE